MGDRSLPPKVEGYPQGRLDLIFGKPAIFPPPQPSQSFIFTFRWWGDIRPCILRLPPEKSETRITHMVTCSAQSFRQYLSDMRNLHVTLKIGGEGQPDTQDNHDSFEQHTQSPRRMEGDTPRQRLLRRQQRLKKGWQDGDVVGSFVLQDLKLNARGDYVNEGRILDSSGDLIGSAVVTMVFLEGTLEEFQQIKIQSEEIVSPQPTTSPEKMDAGIGRHRLSGIPVPESRHGKPQKTPTQEGFRPRSWSFRESIKQKCDKLKSPKKQQLLQQQQQQQHSFDFPGVEKENQAPYRKRASSFTKSSGREGSALQEYPAVRKSNTQESHLQQPGYTQSTKDTIHAKDTETARHQGPSHTRIQDDRDTEVGRSPQLPHRAIPQKVPAKSPHVVESSVPVVRRERKVQEGVSERARPASWGLYPLLNGADPHSLVDSGAVRAEELPILLQVLEGHSPNIDLSNIDPKTQKLLDGLDLSLTSGSISGSSPGRFTFDTVGSESRGHSFSVFNKGGQKDKGDPSGVAVSGVWPLEDPKPSYTERTSHLPPIVVPKKVLASEKAKFDSPKKSLPVQSKIPMSQGGRTPVKALRSLSSRTAPEKKLFSVPDTSSQPREDGEAWMEMEKTAQEKYPSDEGSLLVVDVGTLTLSSPLLPPTPPEVKKKVTGARVLHRSRVCYLTTLDISLPVLEPPLEWDLSQTCASRQLVDHEVHYNVCEALKLPPVPLADILKGHLIIRCVCRRLGERENEEVGSSSISLLDLWQLNGSEVQVPLFLPPYGSLTRRLGRRARKMEEDDKPQSFAHITLTASLTPASGQGREREREQGGAPKTELRQKSESHMYAWNGAVGQDPHKSREENLYPKKFTDMNNSFTSMDSSSGSDLSEPKLSLTESRQLSQYSKPKILTPSYPKCQESPEFNSIYLPTHLSPSDKVRRGTVHYSGGPGVTGTGENTLGPQYSPRLAPSMDPGYQGYHSSFLSVISEYNGSNNQPVESGGESPCIATATDYCADFIDYNTLGWQAGVDSRREDHRGCCRVHLEILKGRNLPWIEGNEGIPQPPNCYVRTNVGSLTVLTNICRESVNPMWNFAADVLLPYSQLAQTNGSLILKVHHSQTQQRTSPDDLLLGFVSVDATSIWSGHVSLCGWYPLLDLRGAVRGHVKVSLTPHEPPLNVAVSNIRQPVHPHSVASYGLPVNQHLARHSPYPQCSGPIPDQHTAALYFQGDGAGSSVLNSLARPSGALPQFTTKSQREIYNQSLQGIKDSSSVEVNGTLESQASEPSRPYKSTSGDEKGEDLSHEKSEECTAYPKVNMGDRTQNVVRKTSSIPVFASNKTTVKSPRLDDKGKIHSYLPKVDYKDKENVHPTSEVIGQSYCRHKGSIVVRGMNKEPGQDPQHPDTEPKSSVNMHSSLHQNGEKDGRKESTLIKDSLIVSHFRMQKEKERGEELNGKGAQSSKPGPAPKGVMSSSGSDNSQSDSQHSASDSKSTSQSGNKPSSCLKAPGSPSLRVKHVTFAHKLVQHQNGDSKLQSQFSQGEVGWRSHQSSQPLPLTRQDAVSPRDLRNTHSLNLEGSDLQVVPCREGDPQAHSSGVIAQGGITLNGYGTSNAHDRAKEDLIMQFSWMNQSDGCDTPCVSFIESKTPMQHNTESNGTCSSKSPPDDRVGVPSPSSSTSPKKSRKLRSRIAANFTLK